MKNKNQTMRSQGFTLVEVLIAMTLGFFLIAGIGTVYIGSKNTYKLQGQIAELDENARHALRVLKQHIEHAGYASTSSRVIEGYIIPADTDVGAIGATCADGNTNINPSGSLAASIDGAGIAGDTIGLIFMADDSLSQDCLGGQLRSSCLPPQALSAEARYIYNSFSVGDSSVDNNRGETVPMMRCGGSLSANRQDMSRGVESIQFLYGVDIDGPGNPMNPNDPLRSVDHYWNATTVNDEGMWDKIVSVRVGLLIRSVEPVFDDKREETYQVLDQSITTDDRHKRGVYTTTIRLKNVARR